MKKNFLALIAAAALLIGMGACTSDSDNSAEPTPSQAEIPAQLKQGVWTEYDTILVAAGKKTAEELAEMPGVGMVIEGDKAYFFTYTAEETSDPVEGKVTYDKATGKGSITFPISAGEVIGGQTVNFTATSDETLEFELTYEGKKTTATCAWLCENLDNWDTEITDEDWKALMAYYEQYPADAGPDATIDWSDSDVEGLDEPLVWDEDAVAPARTRAIGIGTVITIGAKILGALFEEEKPDPNEVINQKLDKVTGKIDQVLEGQERMMEHIDVRFNQIDEHFKKVNERLIAIAQKLEQKEIVDIFNNRNEKYYNPLKAQNNAYFDDAYKLYNENKSDLSKVKDKLGEYGKLWVDDNEQYLKLTWQYIEHLSGVQHTRYGTGMGSIYDGLTFDKYAWEHLGTDDRQSYRAYDISMITKSLFMISLYATYCDMSDIKKDGIYKNYNTYKDMLKEFSEFKIVDPNEFRVCQIPGAHFVMYKELQKYYYKGKNNEAPDPAIYGPSAVYRPEWHEAGAITIENPYELKLKLISCKEAEAIFNYFKSAVYPTGDFWWVQMLVFGDKAAGAVLAKEPEEMAPNSSMKLLLYDPNPDPGKYDIDGVKKYSANDLWIGPLAGISVVNEWEKHRHMMGVIETPQKGKAVWGRNGSQYMSGLSYYAAIVQERY